MKITKSQLKRIIKEELRTVLEQQSPEDLKRAADEMRVHDRAARREKYGRSAFVGPSSNKGLGAQVKIIDMLAKLTDMVGTLPSIIAEEVERLLRER